MDEMQYLSERLEQQIKWFSDKSKASQFRYKFIRIAEIIIAAFIPLLTTYIEVGWYIKVLLNISGILLAILGGVLTINNYQEKWINYRIIAENLKREKYLFLAKSGVYKQNDGFSVLVERTEAIMAKENTNWVQMMKINTLSKLRGIDNGKKESVY